MPRNQFQRMIFALLTVVITVHGYVFYSLYVVNGSTLMEATGADSVLHAIQAQGGVYMFGHMLPIWAVVLIEFCFAYALECLMGSLCSFKIACRVFRSPKYVHLIIFETMIISVTVLLMCPTMSLIASLMYYPYYNGFHLATLLANWLKLVCYNFPFAFFSQLFFIQPFVRAAFRVLFRKDIANREKMAAPAA